MTSRMCRRRLITLVWGLVSITTTYCQSNYIPPQANDIQEFLSVLDKQLLDGEQRNILHKWDHDLVAVAGKLFSHNLKTIGSNAERRVAEIESEILPAWLEYDHLANELFGVAEASDVGKEFIVTSTDTHTTNETMPPVRDVISISVITNEVTLPKTAAIPVTQFNNHSELHAIKCPHESSVTTVTIVTNSDLGNMRPRQKRDLLSLMGKHLNIPTNIIRILPLPHSSAMMDSSALVAGPGDVTVSPDPGQGAMVQWEVGCGNVYSAHMPILQRVEETSADGKMSQSIGHGIVGWHVTNKRPQVVQRVRRAVNMHATATLMPGHGPPTQQSVPTVIIDPYTRVVPSMASPDFPEEMHPSRPHQHRTKTQGRHMHHHTRVPKQSPRHHKTMYPYTAMPTATLLPIMPTATVDIAPTLVDSAAIWPEPTIPGYSMEASRTDDFLQPSMTVAVPPSHVATELLPSRTYIVTDMLPTEVIEPTETHSTPSTIEARPSTDIVPISEPTRTPTPKPTIPDEIPYEIPFEIPFNYKPEVVNAMPNIVVQVGDVLMYKIPEETFHDAEDGNTRNLKLFLQTEDGYSVSRLSWLFLNESTQTLYGLPLPNHKGRMVINLNAIDSTSQIAKNYFEVEVVNRTDLAYITHQFSMTLDMPFDLFYKDVHQRIDVTKKLAAAYGDSDLSNIVVNRVSEGSVVYAWHNKTLQRNDGSCPVEEIEHLLSYFIAPGDTLSQEFIRNMSPYRVKEVGSVPRGSCDLSQRTTLSTTYRPDEVGPIPDSESDVLITVIVPAVVLACLLLVACCIACCLYRRKRKGELSDEDQHTFINRGIPIIFADELEDKPEAPTKPLILRDEKPPLPPPHYPQSLDSLPSSPESDKKDGFYSTDDGDDMMSPLYRPPPPLTGSQDRRRERAQAQPTYRRPPPYIPP